MNMDVNNSVFVQLASRSYEIKIEKGGLDQVGQFLASFKPISRVVILTDENVARLKYADRVAASIVMAGMNVNILAIAPGERSKSIETAATLWETLLSESIDRKSVIVVVGGGVIGDLGGFVAATYSRGIRFFQVPTTLLSQVDSSVGGKVGIDLPNGKNMVGAFHQPLGVMIDPDVLQTLSDEQYASGLGEVVKYGISLDTNLFEMLESHVASIRARDPDCLGAIIAACCRIKAQIVAKDEQETTGLRALLNYGHTFGHAFEIQSDFSLPHGIAVAIGSICASQIALQIGLINSDVLQRQIELHKNLGLPVSRPAEIDWKQTLELMRNDKKASCGKRHFVLPTGLGTCRVFSEDELGNAWQVEAAQLF
ncbi:MAG: 3-dehydroquinate synthase [Thermoguttaceae bacterium]